MLNTSATLTTATTETWGWRSSEQDSGAMFWSKMVSWNVPHGPWSEDVRYKEVVGAWTSFFKRHKKPATSPLFLELLPYMCWEQGLSTVDGSGADKATLMWQRCNEFSPFEKKGCKSNMNRFLSYLGKGQEEAPLHSMRLLGYLTT